MEEMNETMVEGMENVAEVISENSDQVNLVNVGLIGLGAVVAIGTAAYIGKKFVVPGIKKGKEKFADWRETKKEEAEAKKIHDYVEVDATVIEEKE